MIAVYCRVSTEDQQERKTIENQIDFAQKYCDLHELKIFRIYKEDGVSGTIALEDRPIGKELIEDAKNNKFDTLLLYKLDRLGRSARITLNSIHMLEKLGIEIKSMTEPFDTSSPSGRFMITMLAGVADLERSTILERMWLGANRAAKDGKWLGGIVPYGYFVNEDKYLEINDTKMKNINLSEADIVKIIFNLCAEKHYSTVQISDYLNSLNIPTSYQNANRQFSKGKRKTNTAGIWRPGNVLRMLHNKTYKGVHEYGKRSKKKRDIITREVPAIVTEEVWNKVQKVIEDNKLEATRNSKKQYLLRGLIKCANCGKTYIGVNYTRNNNYYYVCNGKIAYRGECNSKNLNGKYIENLVWQDIVNFINSPKDTIGILKNNIENRYANKENLLTQKKLLESNLYNKNDEKQSILDLFRKGIINASDLELQLNKINDESNIIKDNLNSLNDELNEVKDTPYTTIEEMLQEMKNKIDTDTSFEDKRKIVKTLVDEILVKTIEENGIKRVNINVTYLFVKDVTHRVKDS